MAQAVPKESMASYELTDAVAVPIYTVAPNKRLGYRFMKRTFDIAASLIGLIFLSPLFLIVAAAIYIDDPGPVLFFQERNGLNGRVFRMVKFRSMFRDAPEKRFELESQNELDGPAFKMANDPRITRVGRFIRRTSIDELPQLVNILLGQMSIVGPRPLPTYETEQCSTYQKQRMTVKPGLTCYWQCSGRNTISFDDWIEMDLKYIREAGIWVDFKIICKTVISVVGGGGRLLAYRLIKRTIDIIISLTGLILCSPVMAAAAIAILKEDGAPVIYKQRRIGENSIPFEIYKFRSMVKEADEIHEQMKVEYQVNEVSFKLKDDPRITKTGRVLRKFNIDEFPQLVNVLKGEMSLVGPRPLPDYEFEEEQRRYHDTYSMRYSVPQGLTCFWQISDRSEIDFEERMRMDVEYAQRSSLSVDLMLIIKTFLFTITGKAEY